MQTLAKFVNTGKVEDGEVYVEVPASGRAALDEGAPHKWAQFPAEPAGRQFAAGPMIRPASLWGRTAKELCNF